MQPSVGSSPTEKFIRIATGWKHDSTRLRPHVCLYASALALVSLALRLASASALASTLPNYIL
jgi:hypothetical protein